MRSFEQGIDIFEREQIESIRREVGDEKVLLALSGGVDSSVCAALLAKAVPGQSILIFVDHGLMRKNEPEQIADAFSNSNATFVHVNAAERFLTQLKGVTDPEKKRKIIGAEFINLFKEEAEHHGDIRFFAQGTIYPDIIESGIAGRGAVKSHHNVGGLPDVMPFSKVIEPLKSLYKNEVRELGRHLGLDESIVNRQPFPGPGLAVRVIGEITKEKLEIVREADYIFRSEIESAGVKATQYFAILTDIRSVGVSEDSRTYDYTIALRAVETMDFMTCTSARVPYEVLEASAKRIVSSVVGVNRVVFDITSKPPGTIEWE